MSRVEELKLYADPRLLEENLYAPQLHTSTLCIGSHFKISMNKYFLTERLLRRVELSNCKISWDSRLLAGLSGLRLEPIR